MVDKGKKVSGPNGGYTFYQNWGDFLATGRFSNNSSASSGKSPINIKADVPLSDTGNPVPYVIGRRVVSEPCVLYYGNLTPIYTTDTATTTTSETIRYDNSGAGVILLQDVVVQTTTTVETTYISGYNIDVYMGICLGPEVKLVGVYYNNKKVWTGSIGPDRDSLTLPNDLGAVSGATVIFHGGAFDQALDPLTTEPDSPSYVGLAYAIVRNVRADLPLEGLFFEVERFPNPLGLTSDQNRYENDINPVTAIVDILTSDWGGAGISASYFNTTNLKSRAVTLRNEKNMCSIIENSLSPIKGVCGALLKQINGILYQNPRTAKLELSLVRQDYTININYAVGDSDINTLRRIEKTDWPNTLSKMFGNYTSRENDYAPDSIYVQSSSVTDKSKIGQGNYGYVMNKELCRDLISRDLSYASTPLFNISIETSRKIADALPGTVLFVSWSKYQLFGLVVYASKVRELPIDTNTVIVEANLMRVPNVSPVFDVPGEVYNPNVDFSPLAPEDAFFVTAPYWIARAAGGVDATSNTDVVVCLALPIPVNDLQSSFDVLSKYSDAGVGTEYIAYVKSGLYSTYAEIKVALDKYDGWTTGKLASLDITNVVNSINLSSVGAQGVKDGKIFAFLDDEIISFESVTNTGVGEYTLNNVHRALLDTVAASHAANARLLIIGNNYNNVLGGLFSYPLSISPSMTVISNSAYDGDLSVAASFKTFPSAWHVDSPRTLAPLRPSDTKLNGTRNTVAFDAAVGDDVDVTWKTRVRTTSTVKDQTDAAEISEVNSVGKYQYHTVVVVDAAGAETEIVSTPNTASANSITATLPGLSSYGPCYLYVKSKFEFAFGILSSVYKDMLPINIYPTSMYVTEDSTDDDIIFFTSEDGLSIYTQE